MKCFECDARAEHKHHVIPKSVGGKRTIPLCIRCHEKVHGMKLYYRALHQRGIDRAKINRTIGAPRKLPYDKIIRKRKSGMSLGALAEHFNCSRSAIIYALKRGTIALFIFLSSCASVIGQKNHEALLFLANEQCPTQLRGNEIVCRENSN